MRLAAGGLDGVAGGGPAVLHHRGQGGRQVGAAGDRGLLRRRRPMRPSACVTRARVRHEDLAPVELQRDLVRGPLEVGDEGLVEDAEQAALHLHRQPPVLAERSRNRPVTPARLPRSRAARRSVGTSPRSSSTIGRTSKMKVLVASSVCWTMATSWRISTCARAGSLPTSRSTIWAWRTMLVRLWAGPSCIARASSRRRSSWADSSIRGTRRFALGGGRGPGAARHRR